MTTGLNSAQLWPRPCYLVRMGSFAVSKGKRGEREVCDELQPIVDSVATSLGMSAPRIRRNLQQSGDGGEDIIGLPWYAIEVKRCETLALDRWWRQCVTQARRKAAMASAWDDLSRGGWRKVAASMAPVCPREEAATTPRDASGRDEAAERGGGAVGGDTARHGNGLSVAGGDRSPVKGLAPLGWMLGRAGGSEPAEGASEGAWRDLGGERVPVLVWRRSRQAWQVRARVQAATAGGGLVALDIDVSLAAWLGWLALDLRGRLQALADS